MRINLKKSIKNKIRNSSDSVIHKDILAPVNLNMSYIYLLITKKSSLINRIVCRIEDDIRKFKK